ncbi:MAG: pyridoxamine 5-phosphate oxidase [Alphaproteobacteria bacterium HGW-Alphaproteobacteria-6]|nr:MAG: pyridoxamine 5-phosphate oxidase [Alphaproteobacteria bacterium HGW-Alphaproteobacteria-6]
MTTRYLNTVFSDHVKSAQQAHGSRAAYARLDGPTDGPTGAPDRLTDREIRFIAARDSLYMASTGAGGWPYLQHRGGPAGFVKVLDDRRLGFADFRGNRQYVSLGNLAGDARAAFFFMDYPQRQRLKLLGHVRMVGLDEAPDLAAALIDQPYGARVEHALVVEVEAFDWNCPQHITPRYSLAEIAPSIDALKARIGELEAEVTRRDAGTRDRSPVGGNLAGQ